MSQCRSDVGSLRLHRAGRGVEQQLAQVAEGSVKLQQAGDRDTEAGRKQQPHDSRDSKREDRNRGKADELGDGIAGGAADNLEIEDRRPHDLAQRKGRER